MRREEILVYTTAWCPDCHRAKAWLKEQGIPFKEIDIELNPEAARVVMEQNGGRRRVPTFVIRDRYFGNPPIPELERILTELGYIPGGMRQRGMVNDKDSMPERKHAGTLS